MFQIWACKQVTNIAGVNSNQTVYTPDDPMCPSCNDVEETCGHVLCCDEEGRVKALNCTIDLLDSWMKTVRTKAPLRKCLTDFARKRGGVSMEHIVWGKGPRFYKLGQSMDMIGWRQFMEGLVSSEVLTIQADCVAFGGCSLSLDNWTKGISIKLLEVTHGQWLYRNMLIHDTVSGLQDVERKEDLQKAIKEEIEVGGAGLDKQDRYLLEINLEDLETSSGEDQYYWLIAIRAARADRILRRG